jgi:hypothetical protein
MTMHEYLITDETGETVDAVPLCSDWCHREHAGDEYAGWDGAHESEFTTWCAQCGVVIPGASEDDAMQPCECQTRNVVVARFLSDAGERCEHGNWVQLPAAMLAR